MSAISRVGQSLLDRRELFAKTALTLPAIALTQLLTEHSLLADETAAPGIDPAAPHAPRHGHFRAKARNVIVVFCAGACSQLETWDYKPELARRDGQPMPGGPSVTFQGPSGNLARPQYRFRPYGECGKMVSDMIPHLAQHVDDFAFVHTLTSKTNTHGPAENFLSTGFVQDGFPSIGAWVSYALGTINQNLPAFIAIPDPRGIPQASVNNWGSGFLPAVFQGTAFNTSQPIRNLHPPGSISSADDTLTRQLLGQLNARHLERNVGDQELSARIASYELAARMQVTVPHISDLSSEPLHVLHAYGADDSSDPVRASYAKNCILARRLIESGVRFVQLFNGAYASAGKLNWDGHQALREQYDIHGRIMDQPTAALFADLKQRGLLEETLFVWCTEFGRMPMFQKGAQGRDHNPAGFTAVLAGAGIKPGVSYGVTDELGFKSVQDVSSVHDLNATILHLLGLDHTRLTFRHNGVARRLTDVHGHVLDAVLA